MIEDLETESLLRISAALGAGDREALVVAFDMAEGSASPLAVEEVLLQSYLFVGYPAALNGLTLWRERSGVSVTTGDEVRAMTSSSGIWEVWRRRGEEVCREVYGEQYPRLRENIARLHPDLEEWMIVEGYGKVLGRAGLPLRVRELCIAVLLAGLDAAPQLRSHLRGSLLVGASVGEVEGALEVAYGVISPDRIEVAQRVWGEVRERWESREG